MFTDLVREIDSLIINAIELAYFMRGAISYESMLMRTPGELQRISDFVSRRLEIEAKRLNPNY